jgi:putative membrane protein
MKILVLAIGFALGGVSTAQAKEATDQTFVTKAAEGGLAEVDLGNVASAQGSRDAVKTFGKRMVTDHTKANDQLKSTASSAGLTVPSEPSAEQKAMAAKLKAMSGAAFDKAYADAMVKDHKEDVALFEKEAKYGKDSTLKAFANDTLPTLKDHLKMAEDMKAGTK